MSTTTGGQGKVGIATLLTVLVAADQSEIEELAGMTRVAVIVQ